MDHRSLQEEYARLRAQLAEAYSAPVWQPQRIDGLADALADIERRLVSQAPHATWRSAGTQALPSPSP